MKLSAVGEAHNEEKTIPCYCPFKQRVGTYSSVSFTGAHESRVVICPITYTVA